MAYTLKKLKNAAELAMGGKGRVPDGADLELIVSAAVDRLCAAHPWAWLNVSASLTLTDATAYVDLPADFEDLLAVQGASTNRYTFQPNSMAEILRMRAQVPFYTPVGEGMLWFYAVGMTAQASTTAAPRYRLQFYPTPTATEAAAITLYYRKRVAIPAADADVVELPPAAYHALLEVVRAEASKGALDGTEPRQAVYEANDAAAERAIQRLKGRDGGEQTNLGYLTGGVGEEDVGVDHLYPTQISPA